MGRLPSALQPAWPLFKRASVYGAQGVGVLARSGSKLLGERGVPTHGTSRAEQTVALCPDSTRIRLGGPAEQLHRTPPTGIPHQHWSFRQRADFDVPRRFTLEIERGLVTGSYAAHITPEGVLDFETSPYFGIDDWRRHPLFLRPRMPVAEHVDGTLASIAAPGSYGNYYHFLLDVLPRFGVLRETHPDTQVDAWFVNTTAGYQRQLLELAGLGGVRTIEPTNGRAHRADRLLVPAHPNEHLMAPTWTVDWLRDRLRPARTTGLPKRLYLTRGSTPNTRRLVDEDALLPVLEAHGFERLDPGTLSVQEQIDHFAAAEAIVAPHGAALSNLVFCRPGVRVLELFAPTYVQHCYWVITDQVPESRYRYLVCGTDPRGPGAPMNGVLADISTDAATLAAAVADLLA